MQNFYRIAKKDVDTLLESFSNYASKDVERYKRIRYEKWKRLRDVDSWEIRFSYGYLRNDITIRAIKGDPVSNSSETELFEFQSEDGSFGSFLEFERKEGVLMLMSSMFDENIFADVSVSAIKASDAIGTISATVSSFDYDKISTSIGSTNSCDIYLADGTSLNGMNARLKKLEEKETMNTGIKFNFGTCEKDNIRLSMYGIAVKNAANEWVSYDAAKGDIINVDIFNFDGGKYLFKMPVAIKEIAKGDTIVHNGVPMYVKGFTDGEKNPVVVDPKAGEEKVIIPTKNMFGFDFVTKVVSLFSMGSAAAPTKDSPFGNMWPLMLADKDIDPMMLMMMSGGMKDMNPMMMYALMNNKGNNDTGLLMAMMMGSMSK